MAIYHLNVKTGSRNGGQSALAHADYIERAGRYSRDRDDVEHQQSGNMPKWAADEPGVYWAAADEHERSNGRLFRDVEFALPYELDEQARVKLAAEFAEQLTGPERLPYTMAIHRGGEADKNPHVHLMLSERANDGIERDPATWFKRANTAAPEKGGARKSMTTRPRDWLKNTRESWEQTANRALERAGREERIDHRSLAAQKQSAIERGDHQKAKELDREPGVHLGPVRHRQLLKIRDEVIALTRDLLKAAEKVDKARSDVERGEKLKAERRAARIEAVRTAMGRPVRWMADALEQVGEYRERRAQERQERRALEAERQADFERRWEAAGEARKQTAEPPPPPKPEKSSQELRAEAAELWDSARRVEAQGLRSQQWSQDSARRMAEIEEWLKPKWHERIRGLGISRREKQKLREQHENQTKARAKELKVAAAAPEQVRRLRNEAEAKDREAQVAWNREAPARAAARERREQEKARGGSDRGREPDGERPTDPGPDRDFGHGR